MKRILCLILAVLLLISLVGCTPDTPETTPAPTEPPKTTTVPETTAPTTPPETTVPPTEKPHITGWFGLDGKKYYYNDEGEMVTGWLAFGHDRYYFGEDGAMVTGKREIDGEVCYFGPDGIQIALVNPWNFVPDWYEHETVALNDWQYIDARCYDALMELLQACRDAGYKPYVASAFREHSHQVYLYERKIQRLIAEGYSEADAKRLAGTVVAVPGTSEHELGLAVDLTDNDYRELDEAQENTATQKWLMENSWRYGFILRYPSSKSEATGIIYEPWHYRYVGKATARAVYESGLCLEEYFESER
jgi:hypothetical protein